MIKDWAALLKALAGRLTAGLAFAVAMVIVIALLGDRIPADYRPLPWWLMGLGFLAHIVEVVLRFLAERGQEFSSEQAPPLSSEKPEQEKSEERRDVPPSRPTPSMEEARRAYLEWIGQINLPLRLTALDEHAGDPNSRRLSLEKVYVDLYTTTQWREPAEGFRGTLEHRRPLSVLEALQRARQRRMVLLGLPGTGKSTFVRYLALTMARALLGKGEPPEGWQREPLLPVVISLGRFAESLPPDARQGRAEYVEEFLKTMLREGSATPDAALATYAQYLEAEAREQGALFLFDGLDEVADLALRPVVVQSVEAFARRYAGEHIYFLVTCRTFSYQDPAWQLTDWEQHELALFTDEQIAAFVHAWYEAHAELDPARAEVYREKERKLLRALHPSDRRRLDRVARYPIILTVMAVVHASYELPDSTAEVYQQCVRLLLEKWQVERSIMGRRQQRTILEELGVPRSTLEQALWEVAFEAHQTQEEGAEGGLVTERLLSGVMQEYLGDGEKVQTFLDYCAQANGLLMLQGQVTVGGKVRRVYTWPHLTFEEYLAARYLSDKGGERIRSLLDQAFDRWREVARFVGEHLTFATGDRARMNDLLAHLAPRPPQTLQDWQALWLAGELLLYYRRVFPARKRWLEEEQERDGRIVAWLVQMLKAFPLPPKAMAAVGDVLDELGYRPPDLYTFVPIPDDAGHPAFYIAKYPVTNEQYCRFVHAEDFADPDLWRGFPKFSEPRGGDLHAIARLGYWGDAGWRWLQEAQQNKDLSPDGRVVLPRYWNDPRFGIARPSAPVVGITWYEANAYARWVQRHWTELEEAQQNPGLQPREIRLPTEAEWVRATGGLAPEGCYPWDPPGEVTTEVEEVLRRANVRESGIGRTTPVWLYPLGRSQPYEVWGFGGNIWEWQTNYADEDHDLLILRGGSWGDGCRYARVGARYDVPPLNRWSDFGFRLLLLG